MGVTTHPTGDEQTMTGAEVMMWRLEGDPWMSPSGASVTLFDRPIDLERFRRLIRRAITEVPRLHQRVVDPATTLGTPHWEDDRELDLDWHVRSIRAPGAGELRDVLDWATSWAQDSYDRTRPLWQYVLIDGLEGGGGALAMKLHHVVADGASAVRLAGMYTDLVPDAPEPDDVDLDAFLAALPERRADPGEQVRDVVGEALRLPLAAVRRIADTVRHPDQLGATRDQVAGLVRTAGETTHESGSVAWRARSRRRRLEALSLPFRAAHDAASALGGSLNDLFVAGAVDAAARYHAAIGEPLDRLHLSFVMSTRGTDRSAANAFTPVPIEVPVVPMSSRERMAMLHEVMQSHRERVHGGGPMADVAAVANLLPISFVAGIARSQAGHLDFATSNLPGFLGDTWVAGAKTLHTYIFGPVAGTAFNLTAYSTAGSFDLGINLDPAAVTDGALLRRCLEDAYAELIGAATSPTRRAKQRSRRTT